MFFLGGSGKITIAQLGEFLRSLGQIDPTEEELKELIDSVDSEKKGAIDFPQFLKLMEANAGDSDREVKTAHKILANSEGAIDANKLHQVS